MQKGRYTTNLTTEDFEMNGPRQYDAGFRLWLIILGVTLFLWSGKEDSAVVVVTALGLILSATSVWWLFVVRPSYDGTAARSSSVKWAVLGGVSFGALASFCTALLMLLKDLRHGHVFPDYPPELIVATLERLPAWSLAGGLIGLGLSLLLKVFVGSGRRQE